MTGRTGFLSVGSAPCAREEQQVVFPCNLPQWLRVREELELLLLQPPTASNIAQKLDNVHHISQGREGTDVRCMAVFRGLGTFLQKVDDEERRCTLDVVLPAIIRRALKLPHLLEHDGVPLLLKQKAGMVQLSRRAAASIVACGFLCLFPVVPHKLKETFRPINFTNFFHAQSNSQQSKLRCILHYFERLAQNPDGPVGNITITRKVLERSETRNLDWWQETDVPLCPIKVHREGLIEDCPHPSVQVDFANKKVGGGVLGGGPAQEIRFVTCPELLVTMVLVEAMDDNEAIWVEGYETFSTHDGYGKSLRYTGDYKDHAPVDSQGNLQTILCAIDALMSATHRQYQDDCILRDINKAFIGFLQKCTDYTEEDNLADVERFGDQLSQDILATAARQAALVLTQSRLQEHVRPPSSGERGAAAGGGWHRVDRSDTSDTSSDSHHSGPVSEGERSWMMGMRRRSSNLSDVGSRRSSDLTSRRSSGSTRYSSDASSDLEELYETFPEASTTARQRPAAIKEEGATGGGGGIQDFVSSMVMDVLDEGSSLAAQMMPGVQNFGETQPPDVAKPKAFKPAAAPPPGPQDFSFDFPLDLDSSSDSSNQTDDQKAKENIVRFVSQLVEKAFVSAASSSNGLEDDSTTGTSAMRDMDHLHLHHSWSSSDSSGSPHYNHCLDVNSRSGAGAGSGHQQELHSSGSVIGGANTAAYLHYASYDRSRRLSHPLDSCPRFTPPVDMLPQRSSSINPSYHRMSHHDGSPRLSLNATDGSPRSSQLDGSPRISQLDGSPRSEANAMWRHQEQLLLNELTRMSGRRRSSTDFAGTLPPLDAASRQQMFPDPGTLRDPAVQPFHYAGFADSLQHRDSWASGQHGESLTDDLKEAVANSASAFHAVQAVAAAAVAASSHDDDHNLCPPVPDLSTSPDRNLSDGRLSASHSDTHLRGSFQSKSDTSLLSARHAGYHGYQRQNSLDSERHYTDILHSHGSASTQDGATGFSPYRFNGANTAVTVAGQIVQASLETAVRTVTQQAQAVGGLAQWRSQQKHDNTLHAPAPRCVNFSRSLSLNKPSRKSSMDESLSSFANSLARHGSLGELQSSRFQQRRGSSGFRDATLSSFADQLLDTNNDIITDPVWLEFRRHSVSGERANPFRRGSAESRCSSLSRHSSVDILFPPCSTPEEPPPWGMNPPGRRSSREVVLDLLSTSGPTMLQHRKRQQSLTSHLDWFAQDLLMEAFNDAFIKLFGQDYLESYDYKRRQIRQRSRSRSSHSNSEERQLLDFADAFVQDIFQQAIERVMMEDEAAKKGRAKRAASEEEEDGSSYEDALDIPFQMLDTFATSLAGSVMDAARVELIKKKQRGPHPVATGNWGCGAFRGNPQMKLLLQWAAASCAGAPVLHYYTFGAPGLQRLPEVVALVRQRTWNVGHILQYVVQYARQRRYTNDETLLSLFDLLLS